MNRDGAGGDRCGLSACDGGCRDELITMIYRAGARLDQWPLLLGHLASFFPQGRVLLWLRPSSDGEGMVVLPPDLGSTPDAENLVADLLDPAKIQLLHLRIALAFRGGHLATLGARFAAHASPLVESLSDAAGSDALLLVTRPLGRPLAVESAFLQGLAPLFASAAEIGTRLLDSEDDKAALADILDRLPVGALIVDEQARLVAANRHGRFALQEERAVALDPAGMVRARAAAAQRALADAITRTTAATSAARRVPVKIEDGDVRTILLVCSMAAGPGESRNPRRALILVGGRGGTVLRLGDAARDIYGLSAMEMRIVQGLVEGARLEFIAAAGRTSVHTVRNQLKTIFIKVGVNRQADLVNLILRGPAPFGGD